MLSERIICPYCDSIEHDPNKFLNKDRNDPDTYTCEYCKKEFNVKLFIVYQYVTSKLEDNG